jgi:rhodanese-related sulfurtransferase
MTKGPRFKAIVDDAKSRVKEVSPAEAAVLQRNGAVLIDVREKEDFDAEHATGALPLSKGVLELRIEEHVTDPNTAIILYCGGGSRSALAADSLQRMGYSNVRSLAGGFKAWSEQHLPTE